ncbi:MAG: hypothetical protein EOM72_05310 [Opitutae bacterium]|nr:hypothetical protein [Opitutae bacterium]
MKVHRYVYPVLGSIFLVLVLSAEARTKFIRIVTYAAGEPPQTRIIAVERSGWVTWTNTYIAGGFSMQTYKIKLDDGSSSGKVPPPVTVGSGAITSHVQRIWVDVDETNGYHEIQGVVRWGDDTVPGIKVDLHDVNWELCHSTISDEFGQFAFAQIPFDQQYYVSSNDDGFGEPAVSNRPDGRVGPFYPTGSVTDVAFELFQNSRCTSHELDSVVPNTFWPVIQWETFPGVSYWLVDCPPGGFLPGGTTTEPQLVLPGPGLAGFANPAEAGWAGGEVIAYWIGYSANGIAMTWGTVQFSYEP